MHKEILTPAQIRLLPLVKQFKREYYLVGGTAIALFIGHRRSIDFDLFKLKGIKPKSIVDTISASGFPYQISRRVTEQLNVSIGDVKLTYYQYPFQIEATERLDDVILMPKLIDLAAMKAYAMGRRSKWKDYVDLYFLLRDHFSIREIGERADQIFNQLFSVKLFISQLSYFDDINYSEPVEFVGPEIPEEEIKVFLTEKAIDFL